MSVDKLSEVPNQFFLIHPQEIKSVFPRPTMVFLEGMNKESVFISTLLHGNETSSFYAMQKFLKPIVEGRIPLQRSVIWFIGNVDATEKNLRHLPNQEDFNRIWLHENPSSPIAKEVLDEVQKHNLFASIDIHNNTGTNPLYGCTNVIDSKYIYLASLFSPTIVYFRTPAEVQSMAFSKFCPAVTIEGGKSAEPHGVEAIVNFLESVIHLQEIPKTDLQKSNLRIYHTKAKVRINPGAKVTFGRDTSGDFLFAEDFDHLNFTELEPGTILGKVQDPQAHLLVTDENDIDVTDQFIEVIDGKIQTKRVLIPSMFTKDTLVIEQDCLGYFMVPLPLSSSLL